MGKNQKSMGYDQKIVETHQKIMGTNQYIVGTNQYIVGNPVIDNINIFNNKTPEAMHNFWQYESNNEPFYGLL